MDAGQSKVAGHGGGGGLWGSGQSDGLLSGVSPLSVIPISVVIIFIRNNCPLRGYCRLYIDYNFKLLLTILGFKKSHSNQANNRPSKKASLLIEAFLWALLVTVFVYF